MTTKPEIMKKAAYILLVVIQSLVSLGQNFVTEAMKKGQVRTVPPLNNSARATTCLMDSSFTWWRNGSSNKWTPGGKTFMKYDFQGNIKEMLSVLWVEYDDIWINDSKQIYSYNSLNGSLKSILMIEWD